MIRYHGHRITHKNTIYGLEGRRQTWTGSRARRDEGVKRERDGWMAEPGSAEKRINESLKVE